MTWLIINFHKCVPTYLKVVEKNKFNINVPRRTVTLIIFAVTKTGLN